MGEVYRARDTRLGREVALKVLPEALATHAGRLARFEREARAVSALNHPHICTLHDIGQQDGIDYIVMELLEGATVADRVKRGPLPIAQVLRSAIEIADALDKAHRAGIVHRDLKPGNVMLTKSGAKLLDFGLAKLQPIEGKPGASVLSALATADKPLTVEGTILGTLQYMAPEQLEGREADARTDIWAFGAVVYEMATGQRAFEGKSQTSLIAAILERDPPLIATLQPMAPAALDRLVMKCLAKDPDERWQSAHDVTTELRWIAEAGASRAPSQRTGGRRWRERLGWAGLGAALVAAGFLATGRSEEAAIGERPVRFHVYPPEGASFTFLGRDAGPVVVSPDGRFLAFVATTSAGRKLLFVQPLESLSARVLADSDGASYPFWSPDSRELGFFADGKLKRIAVAGGPAVTLGEAPFGRGGTWNREGVIVFAPSAYFPLYRISSSGGPASPVTRIDEARSETSHRWPHFLSDGRHFVYVRFRTGPSQAKEGNLLYVGSLDAGEDKPLFGRTSSAWAPPGHLLFLRETTLLAMPFDSRQLRVWGEALPIAEQVQVYRNTASTVFSASDNGVLVYQAGARPPLSQLVWFDRGGSRVGTVGPPGDYEAPRLSPEGSRVAVDRIDPETGASSIWLYETSRDVTTRMTFTSFDHNSIWSPDGTRIAFDTDRNGPVDVYQKTVSGAREEEALVRSQHMKSPTGWSPDGRFIVYQELDPATKYDLWLLPLQGDRKPTPLLRGDGNEIGGQVSPDGRWLAYTSDESGPREVYVCALPGPSGKWQVSAAGGSQPRWRRDGRELFYLGADRRLMAAPVKQGPTFEAGAARPLFETRARYTSNFAYDVSADGQSFLINTVVQDAVAPPITVVLGWAKGLKKR